MIVINVLNSPPIFTFVPTEEIVVYVGGTEFVKLKYHDPDGVPIQLMVHSGLE